MTIPFVPRPFARLRRSGLAVLAAAALVGCGLGARKTTRDDCESLADRFAELAHDAQEEADRRCAVKRTPEEHEADRRLLADVRDDLVRTCSEHVGENHAARDARCLEGAQGTEALRACAFVTPFFHELSAYVLASEKLVELRCKGHTKSGTPSHEPRPEDDGSKKKPDAKKKP